MAKLLLGKEVTAAMNEKLQARVAALKEKGVSPKLAIVRCGENPSDLSYEKGATARAELLGVAVVTLCMPVATSTTILSYECHADSQTASAGVFLTTLLSVVSVPAMMLLLFGK